MSGEDAVKAPARRGERRTGKLLLAALLALLAATPVAALAYFGFAREPVAIGNVVVVGPECFVQPAVRVEASYLAAERKPGTGAPGEGVPSRSEFAGIKFYWNVPWTEVERTAPVGAR